MINDTQDTPPLYFQVLGRMLEHFGVQMYKRRDAAIAELVANSWDALASHVRIDTPEKEDYQPDASQIVIEDDGIGMLFDEVQDNYLVLGRNRRSGGKSVVQPSLFDTTIVDSTIQPRRVMGRKGIGKLASFGIGREVLVRTWRGADGLQFSLDAKTLVQEDNTTTSISIPYERFDASAELSSHGTRITIKSLKHGAPLDPVELAKSLSRRFSRTVRGNMEIKVNGVVLPDPYPELFYREPKSDYLTETLVGGHVIRYWFGYAKEVLHSKELQGFSILANGKVAQAPPFFFGVETTATGQHSTRYVTGEIEADYLDSGDDSSSDLISTDRQELDWDDERLRELLAWGQRKSRNVLADCRDQMRDRRVAQVLEDADLVSRVSILDEESQKKYRLFLDKLGLRDGASSEDKSLAETLLRSFEFKQFHDVVENLEQYINDPEMLSVALKNINDWKVLESRAVLEIVRGRLEILQAFEKLLIEDGPEVGKVIGRSNLRDAIGRFPWLLNPEWQVFVEERKISTLLREWNDKVAEGDESKRVDFVAITASEEKLVIIEIKRSGHAVSYEEMARLGEYCNSFRRVYKEVEGVLLYGGQASSAPEFVESFRKLIQLIPWAEMFTRTKQVYSRYVAIVGGDVTSADAKRFEGELADVRKVIATESFYRDREERARGVGGQDMGGDVAAALEKNKEESSDEDLH